MYRPSRLLLLPLLLPSLALAAPPLDLGDGWTLQTDAQLRPRLVLDSGLDFVAGDARRAVISQRSRLGVTLGRGDGLAGRVLLQDVRLWGQEFDTLNDFEAEGFDLQEAWLKVPLMAALDLKVGRQEINLDAQRLVGAVGWSQRGRAFDALRLAYARDGWSMDLFWSKVATQYGYPDGRPAPGELNTDFGGAHLGLPLLPATRLSALYLFNGQWTAHEARHTAGVFADGGAGGVSWTGELYYQFGSSADADVSALLAAGRLGYALEAPFEPAVAVWGEYLSGDGTRAGTFDTLYATNHKFYGEMDLFLNLPVNTANLGLVDVGARLAASPASAVTTSVDWHHFATATDVAGASRFGDEVDLKVVWDASEQVAVRAVYGVFFPGEAIRAPRPVAAGTELVTEHFGYLTLDVRL